MENRTVPSVIKLTDIHYLRYLQGIDIIPVNAETSFDSATASASDFFVQITHDGFITLIMKSPTANEKLVDLGDPVSFLNEAATKIDKLVNKHIDKMKAELALGEVNFALPEDNILAIIINDIDISNPPLSAYSVWKSIFIGIVQQIKDLIQERKNEKNTKFGRNLIGKIRAKLYNEEKSLSYQEARDYLETCKPLLEEHGIKPRVKFFIPSAFMFVSE